MGLALLARVLSRLEQSYVQSGKGALFTTLKPFLLGEQGETTYEALATQLGLTKAAVKVAVYRLRRRYRELLREEIAHTVASPEEVEEQLR
ncbi:MAG: hypothetical protein RMI91_09095 [Gemmatales bacterium]|nr:hypothetical protein [Gemmatales bacterium]MDW7994795.1 hypothetical protein [Gemmatales bacterium]